MRKLLCALLIALVLCATPAPAEEIEGALNDMTLEELYALRERVDERIDALENLTPLRLYPSRTYRVGVAIPAGVYLLRSRAVALLTSVLVREMDPQGGEGASVAYELVLSSGMMRFVEGTSVTLTDVTAYPFDAQDASALDANGEVGEGGYWVGAQIPAGEYAVALAGDHVTANYSIYDDVPGDGAQMLRFEPRAEEGQTVTLEEGWYISLSGCGLRLV